MNTNMGPIVVAVLAGAGLALWFLNAIKKQSADGKACSSSASDKCSDGVGEGSCPVTIEPTTLFRSRVQDADDGGSGGAGAMGAGNGSVEEQEAGQAAMVTERWLGHVPDEVWGLILDHLPSIPDLVAVSMVSRQLWAVATNHPTSFTTPVYTRQARARAVWRHLPWGMDAGRMGCVRRVATGHGAGGISKVVVVGEWVATCGGDGAFKVWDQQEWTCLKTVDTGQGALFAMAECGGMLATSGLNGSIKLWEQETWTCLRTLEGHTSWVYDLVVHGDWLLSCSADKTVRVWDMTSWGCLRVVQTGHMGSVLSLTVHDGKLYCGGGRRDPTIRVIDMTTWASVGVMEGHTHLVNQLVVRAGKLFSCNFDGTIKIWSMGEGRACEQTLEGHTRRVYSMAVLGDRLLTGSADNTLRVWGMDQGAGVWECQRVLRDHTATVIAMVCTRDGRRVLSCDDDTNMFVWEGGEEEEEEEEEEEGPSGTPP